MRLLVCIDAVPAADGSCASTAWIEQPSPWPQMTVEQGEAIGQAFMLGLISVAAIKVFLNRKIHRS
jgi:hypothetical protein